MYYIIIFIILNLINLINGQMSFIGTAAEGFNPCVHSITANVLSMYRESGGRPELENYWDGTLYLDNWPTLSEVRIGLTVDNPAKIELDPNIGRILVRGRTFYITTYDHPPTIDKVQFKIRGKAFGAFPNVERLLLNGENICPNPSKWKPIILGAGRNVGETEEYTDGIISKCGKRLVQHQGLITNGYPSQEGDWPWHAAIHHITNRQQSYKCGGTLITEKLVLTASHCVYEFGHPIVPERILVQLGKHNLKVSGTNTQEFQVYKVIVHENYNSSDLNNDIAILSLATAATFNNYIQPICLWPENKIPLTEVIDKQGIVVGWGFTELDKLSDILSQGRMPIVSPTTCLSSNRSFFGIFLSDSNYCAGFRNGTSVCNGDSGGGMILDYDGVYYIRGIVSLSVSREDKEVCNAKEYVIFTDVAKYISWINDKISTI